MEDTRKIISAEAVPDAEATRETQRGTLTEYETGNLLRLLAMPEADRQFIMGYAAGRVAAYGGRTTA